MSDGADEDEDTVKCERDEKQIKISVISLANTITHPWTVMVKPEDNCNQIRCC